MNRKCIAALMAGGLLLGTGFFGAAAQAAPAGGHGGPQSGHHRMGQAPWRMNDEEAAARAAEMFGVDEAGVPRGVSLLHAGEDQRPYLCGGHGNL